MATKYIQLTTTTADQETAQRIAVALVEQRLAACVQIEGPIESIYRWQGKVEHAQEWRCVVKTGDAHYDRVAQCIDHYHPYECPELLITPIVGGNQSYLDWLDAQLSD